MGKIGGHVYDSSNKAFVRNTKRNRLHLEKEQKRQVTCSEADVSDTPETIYECPVCLSGVTLRKARTHCGQHRSKGEVSASL